MHSHGETRERMLRALARGPHTKPQLCALLGVSAGAISQGIRHLAEDRLVSTVEIGERSPGWQITEPGREALQEMSRAREARNALP